MNKKIVELYSEWVNQSIEETLNEKPFEENWPGHGVHGFALFVLQKTKEME